MNSNLVAEEQQNFEHNIKKEPEEEFLCVLPSCDSGNTQEANLVHVKQENEIQTEKIRKLQCKICQKILTTNSIFKTHKKTHQKQQCKVCNRKVRPQSFEKHMQSHQNEKRERKLECKICCQKFLTNKQLHQHVKNHSKRFQCDLCGLFSSAMKFNLKKHLKLHFVQGQYKCFCCRKLFDDLESFRFHSRQIHGDTRNHLRLTKADLSCRTCGKEFDDVAVRRRHEKSHEEKVQCPICDKKVQSSYLALHSRNHKLTKKVQNFICDICGYLAKQKCSLKYHLEVHLDLIVECKICFKKLKNQRSLKFHSSEFHNLNIEPSKFRCNICHLKLRNIQSFKYHKSTHRARKTCPICSKSLKSGCFEKHMKLHKLKTEEKKFECNVCKNKFFTLTSLTNHVKLHFKMLKCDLCGYRTGPKRVMRKHMSKHTVNI